jgi:proteasome lid subunit RPN8/RPN11
MTAVHACLSQGIREGHEAVVYLLGQTDGETTVIVAAVSPRAKTTWGSFRVDATAMARVVRAAADHGLQVVGQLHTHPGGAYHSDGDQDGARIVYAGYVSIVVPDYGRRLPTMEGAAVFFFRGGTGFIQLDPPMFSIVPARI